MKNCIFNCSSIKSFLSLILLFAFLAFSQTSYAQDADGDGIADAVDLDDDNDGILDTDEGACPTSLGTIVSNNSNGEIMEYNTATGASSVICDVSAAFDIAMPSDGSVYYIIFSGGQISSVDPSDCSTTNLGDVGSGTFNSLSILPDGTLLAGNTAGAVKRFDPVTMTTTDWASGIGGSSGDFCLVNGDIYYASSLGLRRITVDANYNFVSVVTVGSLSGSAFGMTVTATCQLIYGGGGTLRVITDPTTSSASTLVTSSYPGSINGLTSVYEQVGCSTGCVDLDTDLDGIPNYLDLDSDGDGCADAIEGDGTLPLTDLQMVVVPPATLEGGNDDTAGLGYNGTSSDPFLQNLGTNVDTDPMSPTYGVPIPTSTGVAASQGVGASLDGTPSADCSTTSCGAGTDAPRFD